jgi:hypothetical protein
MQALLVLHSRRRSSLLTNSKWRSWLQGCLLKQGRLRLQPCQHLPAKQRTRQQGSSSSRQHRLQPSSSKCSNLPARSSKCSRLLHL